MPGLGQQGLKIDIASPDANKVLGLSFRITGTAEFTRFQHTPEGDEVVDISDQIEAVNVRVGDAGALFIASGRRTWSFDANTTLHGPQTITAIVTAGHESKSVTREVIIDATPPRLTINQPGDVISSAPPYMANLKGTAADDDTGVAAVEWRLGAGGAFQPATGTTNWSAVVPLPGLGTHTVTLQARDNAGNVSPAQQIPVRVVDVTPPSLSIASPLEGDPFPLTAASVTVEVRGTASDTQTGVALVEWALDNQALFTPAIPKAANDWSTWSAKIPIATLGNHTIAVRAKDKVTPTGNSIIRQRGVAVVEPFQPKDPEVVFSAAAYLDDLLNFATQRAKTAATGGVLITRQLLVDTFLQPFTDLVTPNNRLVAKQPVHQVRLCIEVLRRYLANHGRSTPASMEATYRQAAYSALLQYLGTSYEEIRLARVADDANRTALARRLGFDLSQFRPDRLDQLLLQPADLTEPALKKLFGLEETSLKPLADSVLPEPDLLIWQKEHLHGVWQQQDETARSAVDTPLPIIDPDLLGKADLRTPRPGNTANDLWNARQQQVVEKLAAIKARREGQPTQGAGFDLIVTENLGPIQALLALAKEYQRGNPIEGSLRAQQLTPQPFFHLMQVRKLAAANAVSPAEWDDVYAILVQVQKFRLYASWRAEERQKNLTLGPADFQVPSSATLPEALVLPPWRATPQARQAWRRTLQARLQQEQALTQALQSVVDGAEEVTLPMLRDACIAAIASNQDADAVANRLTQELAIDSRAMGVSRPRASNKRWKRCRQYSSPCVPAASRLHPLYWARLIRQPRGCWRSTLPSLIARRILMTSGAGWAHTIRGTRPSASLPTQRSIYCPSYVRHQHRPKPIRP
jgi:hypothetical protein